MKRGFVAQDLAVAAIVSELSVSPIYRNGQAHTAWTDAFQGCAKSGAIFELDVVKKGGILYT